MTVTRVFTLAFAIIGVIALAKFANSGYSSMREYNGVAHIRSLAAVRTATMDATVALSLERSVVQVALSLDEPVPDAFRDIIDNQRRLAAEGVDDALGKIAAIEDFDNASTFRTALNRHVGKIDAIRREVDAQLAKPLSARDAARVYALPFELKDQIGSMKTTVDYLHANVAVGSSQASALEAIQTRAWEGREYGGRARTYFAIAVLRQQAISDKDKAVIAPDRSRADKAWTSLTATAQSFELPQALKAQIELIEKQYYQEYVPTIDEIAAISATLGGEGAADYSIAFEDFFESSNRALDAFADLSRMSGEEQNRYWSDRETAALYAMTFDLVLMVSLCAIFAAAAAFVRGRITKKLEAATQALTSVANGDLEVDISRSDKDLKEIAALGTAVVAFRDQQVELKDMQARAEQSEAAATQARERMLAELQSAFGRVVDAAVAGDFAARVPAEFPDPRLNELAESVNRLLETVNKGVGETGRVLANVAKGDLSQRMTGEFDGAFADLKQHVNETVEQLATLVGQIAETAAQVRSGSGEIMSGAENLAGRAEQQAAALEETNATMERISASVKANAQSTRSANKMAGEAADRAAAGGQVVKRAVAAMTEIETGAAKISDIVSVIDGIAFQTNLLALNAAVEAARAGESGKGFAVVASEVRALAQRSSDASRDIRALIETSASQVADGVGLVTETGASLEGIVASIAEVEGVIKDIASASAEQAASVEEVTSTVSHMDEITQQNAAMADESVSRARTLNASAGELQGLIAALKISAAETPNEQAEDAAWRAAETAAPRGPAATAAAAPPAAAAVAKEPGEWSEF